MLAITASEPRECPKCRAGRTWVQPRSSKDIAHGDKATLFHCCGDGQKLTARIIARTEAEAVATWNADTFDWIDWSLERATGRD
jgi:hypothetical protein